MTYLLTSGTQISHECALESVAFDRSEADVFTFASAILSPQRAYYDNGLESKARNQRSFHDILGEQPQFNLMYVCVCVSAIPDLAISQKTYKTVTP